MQDWKLSVISRVCSELDECLKDFSKLVKVQSRQIQASLLETSTPYRPVSTYCVPQPSTTGSVVSESLIAIMSSMERMGAPYDLPHVQVQRSDGLPEKCLALP